MQQEEMDPALNPELDRVSRRAFVEKMGASTLAAAVLGKEALAQDKASALKDPALIQEDITFQSGNTAMKAFFCRPKEEGKRGSVIVIHEIFGLNDHIKDVTCRVAQAGFNALGVNFFTRAGDPPSPEGGFEKLLEFVGQIPDSQVVDDMKAAAKYLRAKETSNGKVGVVGFCWGGYNAMLAAGHIEDMNAAVAYYGRIRLQAKSEKKPQEPLELVPKMRVPLLGHFGTLDRGIPAADAETLREELKKHGKPGEIYLYEGANHAFNNDTRPSYNAAASKLAWKRTVDWFKKYLG